MTKAAQPRRRTRAASFTKAEVDRFTRWAKSVGDDFGCVEKRPGGVVRLLRASQIEEATPDEESDAVASWDKAVGIQ
jgi:hypothetical protein